MEKRDLAQWFLRITKYADELLDFTGIDWPEPIRVMQTNWIGRSEGAEVVFRSAPDTHLEGGDEIRVFTTRPDTLFGATFMVLAPEHPLVEKLTSPGQRPVVAAYVEQAGRETEIERLSTERDKTGVPLGADAINPVNGERIPIWIADYVLSGYGTGAIMAVPAHDERDFAFARQFGLEIREVIRPAASYGDEGELEAAYVSKTADDVLVNSGRYNGMAAPDAIRAITADLEARGEGKAAVSYRIRDWLVSRQRYWGTPIPVVYCDGCGIVPVPDADLPVLLPETVDYAGSGRQPAAPRSGLPEHHLPALRRPRPARDRHHGHVHGLVVVLVQVPVAREGERAGGPRAGGPLDAGRPVHRRRRARRHAPALLPLLHQGDGRLRPHRPPRAVPAALQPGPGPGRRRRADEQVARQRGGPRRAGRAVRGRHRAPVPDVHGPLGPGRPVEPAAASAAWPASCNRAWTIALDPHGTEPGDAGAGKLPAGEDAAAAEKAIRGAAHRTLAAVTVDYEGFRFNTMVAKLMELANLLFRYRGTEVAGGAGLGRGGPAPAADAGPRGAARHRGALGAPPRGGRVAPGRRSTPSAGREVDAAAAAVATREVPVQVNGKVRDRVEVAVGLSEAEVEALVLARPKVIAALAGRTPDRIIHAGGGRLVNIVVRG